jgi:hypothetical protein
MGIAIGTGVTQLSHKLTSLMAIAFPKRDSDTVPVFEAEKSC